METALIDIFNGVDLFVEARDKAAIVTDRVELRLEVLSIQV